MSPEELAAIRRLEEAQTSADFQAARGVAAPAGNAPALAAQVLSNERQADSNAQIAAEGVTRQRARDESLGQQRTALQARGQGAAGAQGVFINQPPMSDEEWSMRQPLIVPPMSDEARAMQNAPASTAASRTMDASDAILLGPARGGGGPRVRDTRTITTSGPIDEATLQGLSDNRGRLDRALVDRSGTLEGGLRDQGGIINDAAQESQRQAQEQQAAAQEHAQAIQQRTQHADAINQQVLDGKIDPNRVLGDSFSGGRISAAIGLLFAGLAQGQGGVDAFLSQINHTIDRDIAAQESNLANTRAGAQNQQALVGMYRQVYQDEEAAKQAARATMLQSVAQKLQAQQARMGADMTPKELEVTRAQIEQQALQASAAAQAAGDTRVRSELSVSGGGGGRDVARANALRANAVARGNLADSDADRAVPRASAATPAEYWQANARPGLRVIDRDRPVPTSANQVNTSIESAGRVESVLSRLLEARRVRQDLNTAIRNLDIPAGHRARARLDELRVETAPLLGRAMGQGDIGVHPENYETISRISPDIEVMARIRQGGDDPVLRALDGAIQRFDSDYRRQLAGANLVPDGRGAAPTPVD